MSTHHEPDDRLFAPPEPAPTEPATTAEAPTPTTPAAPGTASSSAPPLPGAGADLPGEPGLHSPGAGADLQGEARASSAVPYSPAPGQAPPPPSPGQPPPPPPPGVVPGAPGTTPADPAGYAPDTYYAPGWQPPTPPRPPMDPLAVASVPAGVLVGPVGIGLGLAGVVRTSGPRRRGRGLAVAGTVLGALTTAGWLVGGALWLSGADGREPLSADVKAPTTANAVQLVVGNCVERLPADGDVSEVLVVPCDEEHHAQVVVSADLDDGDWPGQAEVNGLVSASCGAEVLGAAAPKGVELVVWAPSEASWADGDRTGLCLVWGEQPLEKSFVD